MTTKNRALWLFLFMLLTLCPGCAYAVAPSLQSPPADLPSQTRLVTPRPSSVATQADQVRYQFHPLGGKHVVFRNLDELESASTAIVIATALDSKPNPDLDPKIAIMLTTVEIDKVILSDGIIAEGDRRTLVEYYRQERDPKEHELIHIFSSDDSLPLQVRQHYLLFLQKSAHEFGEYAVTGGYQGKYPFTERTMNHKLSSLTAEDMEFSEDVDNDTLWALAGEVADRYLK